MPVRDGEDVGIEDDVLGREPDLLGEDAVGALADLDPALDRGGLALLVERHHDDGGAQAADDARLADELLLALLEADRVGHALALQALEAGLEDGEARAVDHHRDARDVRLGGDEVEEAPHRHLAVEHALVHAHVEDVGAALDLLPRHLDGRVVVAVEHQAAELARAGDVGALADQDEVRLRRDGQRLEPGQARVALGRRRRARGQAVDRVGDGGDVLGPGAAAAADDVEPAGRARTRPAAPPCASGVSS